MSCTGFVIVFSGFRDELLKKQIEDASGKVAGSLVKGATHLLSKKDSKPSKKVDEAKEKGVEIVFLEDFLETHGFGLAEKKPRAKKEKETPSDDEADKADKSDLELIYAVMRALQIKDHPKEALDALAALEELKKRISA